MSNTDFLLQYNKSLQTLSSYSIKLFVIYLIKLIKNSPLGKNAANISLK